MANNDTPSKPVMHRWNVNAADTALLALITAGNGGQPVFDAMKQGISTSKSVGERNVPMPTDGAPNLRIQFVGQHNTPTTTAAGLTVNYTVFGYDQSVDGEQMGQPIRLAKGIITFGTTTITGKHPCRPNDTVTANHIFNMSGTITNSSAPEMSKSVISDSVASNVGWARLQLDPQTCTHVLVLFDTFAANLGRVDCQIVKQG